MEPVYEKLGVFYLGGEHAPGRGTDRTRPLLYDAKDLTTHAVVVGMTGSGKTGLCLTLLEEAAIDGIPALVIDPKGDLGNLALAFPDLAPASFLPWIDADEAARNGRTPAEHAAAVADRWRRGLADWNQEPARIARFRDAAEVAIYTPGSRAGLPVSVMRSFGAPPPEVLDDADALRERVQSTVSGLLAMAGADADPVRSREHVLLSHILLSAWNDGRDADLASLIRDVQTPAFRTIGVLDLESFFPAKDRFALAMQLNNLLAAPGFAQWMEGEPLDLQRLLWTPDGRPRIAVMSIAHLAESERMFFVTILLNQVVAWMRRQSGTSSLRAIVYMDEVAGYLPPTAAPPSKLPMLTLLKQARAYGVGVVLATQNPVDLDYKALSNAGTWCLGRLQTERDKLRVLDGLEGASAAAGRTFDRATTEAILSGLGNRVFLMNDAHRDAPVLFETRWALSYLRGPLTRAQIRTVTQSRASEAPGVAPAAPASAWATGPVAPPAPAMPSPAAGARPVLPPDVPQVFLRAKPGRGAVEYRPALLGLVRIHYSSSKPPVDHWTKEAVLAQLRPGLGSPWDDADVLARPDELVAAQPEEGASWADVPAAAASAKSYAPWQRDLLAWVLRERTLELRASPSLGIAARPGESEGEFLVRLRQAARERRDLDVAKLRQKVGSKVAALESKVRTAEERVAREASQAKQAKIQTGLSFGSAILGALFGGRGGLVGRGVTAARGVGRAAQQSEDVDRAEANLDVVRRQLAELREVVEAEVRAIQSQWDAPESAVETASVAPRKPDLAVERLALCWTPWRAGADGEATPAW